MCQDISKNQNGTEFWDDRFLSMAQCEFGFKVLSVFSYNLFSDIMWKRSVVFVHGCRAAPPLRDQLDRSLAIGNEPEVPTLSRS